MTPLRRLRGTGTGSGTGTGAGDLPARKRPQANEDLRNTNRYLLPTLFFALLVVAFHFGLQKETATALLWSMAYLLGGATLGFLFGIPKVLQGNLPASSPPKNPQPQGDGTTTAAAQASSKSSDSADAYRQQVNTNLTEISDWLTKIIVGLGLINLAKIPPQVSRLADTMATGLNSQNAPNEKSFALGIILCFSFLGFLFGYLYTRLFLAAAFSRADTRAMEVEQELQQVTEQAGETSTGRDLTEQQVDTAQKVARIASQGDISIVRNQMLEFAREYERVRAAMPASEERTRKLDQIVAKMRTMALAAYPLLQEFAQSKLPGDRLAAVAMLQVQANPEYIDWLADRIVQDKPFIAYHAAQALLTAVRSLGRSYYPVLGPAIQRAREFLKSTPYGADTDKILQKAEEERKTVQGANTPTSAASTSVSDATETSTTSTKNSPSSNTQG